MEAIVDRLIFKFPSVYSTQYKDVFLEGTQWRAEMAEVYLRPHTPLSGLGMRI